MVEATARKLGLTGDEKEAVLRELIEGADLCLRGLSNSVTSAAQKAVDYDRTTELEARGGRLRLLSACETKDLVQARR